MAVYPGDPEFALRRISSMDGETSSSISEISIGSHTGTHLDAPAHLLPEGQTVDRISPGVLIGPAKVIEIRCRECILPGHLIDKKIAEGDRILFKTANSMLFKEKKFHTDYIYVSPEGAQFLVERKVCLVGIDCFSVDPDSDTNLASHKILLTAQIPILEGLDLSTVEEGEYILIALPLKISNGDGSPIRAVLLEDKS